MNPKTIIIAYWKESDRFEAYSSLLKFTKANDKYNYHTVGKYLRLGKYENDDVIVKRVSLN